MSAQLERYVVQTGLEPVRPNQFSAEEDEIIDSTDSRCDLNGRATAGSLADSRMPFAISFVSEWYGWVAYHPQASI